MSEEKKRGLAALSLERRREIAAMGGKSVPAQKRMFSKSPDLAKCAGSKGGKKVTKENRAFFKDPKAAAAAGQLSARKRKSFTDEISKA